MENVETIQIFEYSNNSVVPNSNLVYSNYSTEIPGPNLISVNHCVVYFYFIRYIFNLHEFRRLQFVIEKY